MKKRILLLVLLMFTFVSIYSQSIIVKKPNSGTFTKNNSLQIVWIASGITGNVKINLRKADGSGGAVIQASYPVNKLTYSYPLSSVIPGKYFIKIKQGKVFGKSQVFTVSNTSSVKPSIKVLYPNGGETFYRYDKKVLRWKYIGFTSRSKVDIWLMRNGKKIVIISQNTPNQTSQELTFTKDNPNLGSGFKIMVETRNPVNLSKKISDVSDGSFTIRTKDGSDNNIQMMKTPLIGNNVQTIAPQQMLKVKQTTLFVEKPNVIIKNIFPKDKRIEMGKDLELWIYIENCSKAQVVEMISNTIHKLKVVDGKVAYAFKFKPKNSGKIRIEGYNHAGWTIKSFICEILPKGYLTLPDLEIQSFSIRNITGGTLLKAGEGFNFLVRVLNKGADIPRGTIIEVVRDKIV